MKTKQTLEQLGARLQEVREQKGISQKTFGRFIGEDVFYIQRLELGLLNLDMADLFVLIHELDLPLSEFFKDFE